MKIYVLAKVFIPKKNVQNCRLPNVIPIKCTATHTVERGHSLSEFISVY